MTARINDRDMLVRTLAVLDDSPCCDFFACPGSQRKPVPMGSCATAAATYELRQYLRKHGGWCPEHFQRLDLCHPAEQRNDPDNGAPWRQCSPGHVCRCQPIDRTPKSQLAE